MECWACGFLTKACEGLHHLDVGQVSEVCPGGWGFAYLRIEGAWIMYHRLAGACADLALMHRCGLQAGISQDFIS